MGSRFPEREEAVRVRYERIAPTLDERSWRLFAANEAVAHFPPGTSKWNKIEHRMFSMISMKWRGKPLVSYEAIVELIASTRSTKGLTIRCELDEGTYETGRKFTDEELDDVFNLAAQPPDSGGNGGTGSL